MQEMQNMRDSGESQLQPVLVAYRFLRFKFSRWREEAIMLHVAHSDEIEAEFNAAMLPKKHANYELLRYMPRCGKARF